MIVSRSEVIQKVIFLPYLKCVHPKKVQEVLFELHEGSCGSHTGGRSLAHRIRNQSYRWPYMQKDALVDTKKCDECQKYPPIIHRLGTQLFPLTSPWPFAQWGLDILGPFFKASRLSKFLLVATDYFTKWVEAVPLVNIADSNVKTFLWDNIVTRFGVPKTLVTDNGTQFKSKKIYKFCEKLGIWQSFSSVAHPQTNG